MRVKSIRRVPDLQSFGGTAQPNRAIRLQKAAFYLFVALVFLLLFNNYRYSVESKSRRMDRS